MTEHLLALRDEDIFGTPKPADDFEYTFKRVAVKAIVFDQDNNVALVGTKYLLLPGGGVEEGETLEEALVRECMEELGCNLVIEGKVGTTEEYRVRDARYQVTHCFIARVVGEKGVPTTEQEDERGIEVEWMPLADAYDFLERQIDLIPNERYNSCFNVRAHTAFVEKFMNDDLDGE